MREGWWLTLGAVCVLLAVFVLVVASWGFS